MRCFDMPCQIFFVDEYENDAQSTHRCCGGTVHIKMATLYVAASALILCAFNIASICFGIYSVNFTLDVTSIAVKIIKIDRASTGSQKKEEKKKKEEIKKKEKEKKNAI
uniref:Uncharacterized protein n=1 Tax=Wuchereria bancrofti TaxID=6293 RepID=A0A1I8EP27_WUCBA